MMLLGAFAANAQTLPGLPDNSNAPEVSGTDIVTGETHSLQAYLNQGKTVVLYLSASWCGPCWEYHNSHALTDIYNAYGPNGSNEIMVLYVEADGRTAPGELLGEDLPPPAGQSAAPGPQGNWATDTPYPLISDDSALADYNNNSFPSMYIITPTGDGLPGKTTKLTRGTPQQLTVALNAVMANDIVGTDHWGRVEAAPFRSCDAELPVTAYVQGYGYALNSAEVQLKKDGVVVTTQTFDNLDLAPFAFKEITFLDQTADGSAEYEVVLTKVNGEDALTTIPENNLTGEYKIIPDAAIESQSNIRIVLNTDEYPSEMAMFIVKYNATGNYTNDDVVWSNPVYTDTAANKEKTFTYYPDPTKLVEGICYGVVLQDGAGDGWDYNSGGAAVDHGVTIYAPDGTVLFTHNGDFTSQVWQDATFTTDGTLANDKFETSSFAVYPNPSNGIFNFNTEETVDVTVVDLTGKTVHTAKGIENGGSINLSGLQKGMYIAKINGASGERVEKLIIK